MCAAPAQEATHATRARTATTATTARNKVGHAVSANDEQNHAGNRSGLVRVDHTG